MRRGLWFTLAECDRQRQLLLEYNRSGETGFAILQSSYGVAKIFSDETNRYIGTVARENWSSIHSLFFTVQSVSFLANGHHKFSVAIGIGNGLSILIPVNFCTKGFTKYTERNHGSPVAVYIWSSIALDYVVINNIIGRADGHNNSVFSIRIFCTEGVVQGSTIEFAILSSNNDNNISSTFCIAVEGQFAFAVFNSIVLHVNFNISISITLICYISMERTIDLRYITISIYNTYSNFIIFTNNTAGRIERQGFVEIVLHNSEFFFNILAVFFVKYLNGDGGTYQRFICRSVWIGIKIKKIIEPAIAVINNCFAVNANSKISIVCSYFDAICINIIRNNFYRLTKSDLIINSADRVVAGRVHPVSRTSNQIKNNIFYTAKFRKVESSGSCGITALKCNLHGVFTRNQIGSLFVTNIFQSVNAIYIIPYESQFLSFQLGIFWSSNTQSVHVLIKSYAFYFIAIYISDGKLNSVCKVICFTNVISGIFGFVASKEVTTIFYSFNTANVDLVCFNGQGRSSITICFSNNNIEFAIVRNGEGEFKFAAGVGGYSTFIRKATKSHATFSGYFEYFVLSSCSIFKNSFTSYSVNFYTARGNVVSDGVSVFTIVTCYINISAWVSEDNFISLHSGSSNINGNWLDFVNLGYVRITGNGIICQASMNFITIISICQSRFNSCTIFNRDCIQISSIVNKNPQIRRAHSICYPDRCAISIFNCTKGCIINNFTLSIFKPDIDAFIVKVQCIVTILTVRLNNVKFDIDRIILINRCSRILRINQQTTIINIDNFISSVNCNFLSDTNFIRNGS